MTEINRLVYQLHATVFGPTGQNGLRSDVGKLKDDLRDLSEWRRDLLVQVRLMVRIVRYAGIAVLVMYGAYGTGPTVEWIANLLGNARKIVGS